MMREAKRFGGGSEVPYLHQMQEESPWPVCHRSAGLRTEGKAGKR